MIEIEKKSELLNVIKTKQEVVLLYCEDPNLLHPKSRLFGRYKRLNCEDQEEIRNILDSAPEDATIKVVSCGSEKVYHKYYGEWRLWYERYQYDGVIIPDLPKGQVFRRKGMIVRSFIPVESVDDLPTGSIVTCKDGITYTHCMKLSDGMWWLSEKEVKHWEAMS